MVFEEATKPTTKTVSSAAQVRRSNRQSQRNIAIPENLNNQSALFGDIQENSFLQGQIEDLK